MDLMRSGRTGPDLDAALFFDPDEIHSAYLLNDQDAPDKPRLNDVMRPVPGWADSSAARATANPVSSPCDSA
jgi:hypothetical protein